MRVATRNRFYAVGLGLLAVGFASAPLVLKRLQDSRGVNLTQKSSSLTGSQVMRGAYLNTGSQDVGADPEWVGGRYVPQSKPAFAPTDEDVARARADLQAKAARA